jgi:glucose/arabinose dehydrogenase
MCLAGCQTTPTPRAAIEQQSEANGPVLLREGMRLRKVMDVDPGHIRLVHDAAKGVTYLVNPASGLFRVNLLGSDSPALVASLTDILPQSTLTGLAVGPDGAVYVVGNLTSGANQNIGVVRQGIANDAGQFAWQTLVTTEPYPLSDTPFDHQVNGIVVSPDGQWVYLNSGSRTDHGEVQANVGAFPEAREAPLTARVFRLPASATELSLPNDEAALEALGVVFARGTRNAYDLAFAPNGDLFAVDNGPDADYPDELNWLREGRHYGFPWRFGVDDNPQQFPDYSSVFDKRLSGDFTAVQTGAYRADPTFPKSPGGFTEPVKNLGPAAGQYRAADGAQKTIAAGEALYTFTPHRSPLGLVFATSEKMPADLRSTPTTFSAFLLSWGAAGGTLTDRGQDLLHLALTKRGDNYEAVTTQIARDFKNPIDAVLIDNRLYVLEFGPGSAIWEITFE